MAAVTGTYTRYDAKGLREDLTDTIYNISPEDTVFLSMIGRSKAVQTLHEWQTDALAASRTDNARVEGDEYSFSTPSPTQRVGNYTQIQGKDAIISGSLEAVDKAGRKSEMAYQIAKRGAELRLDQEKTALYNQGADAGGNTTARKMATMGAWVKTNVDAGSGGGNPTYTSIPTATRTDGTQRAFTETILKNVIQGAWTRGGKPRVLMVGPVNKARVSGFSGIATRNFDLSNTNPKATAIIAAADVYVSDFGVIRVIPNREQRERDAWLLDPDLLSAAYLRPHFVDNPAKTGDATKKVILVEWTLKVNQEAGLGLAADLTTT